MFAFKISSTSPAGRLRTSVALSCLGLALLLTQPVQTQEPANVLKFFNNYFLTGDYVVAGVGLRGLGGLNGSPAGIATGSITINSVPEDADVMAAFLYWQVVSKDSLGPDSGAVGATFNGFPLSSADGPFSKVLDRAGSAPCWSSGGGTGGGSTGGTHRTYTYRADVRRFLEVDEHERFIANGTYLVQVPDSGPTGNGVPVALGASLVVIYRVPRPPFNAIVLYDGGLTIDNSNRTYDLTVKGFYQPRTYAASITYVVGSGQANKSENLYFDGTSADKLIEANPFQAALGASWDTRTFPVTLSSILAEAPYGAAVSTRFDTAGLNGSDCLTPAMVAFKTEVLDTDADGLLDIWETTAGLKDPNERLLPDLPAMGALAGSPDLFVQIDYMKNDADSYGGVEKPAHKHMPVSAALKLAGDAYKRAGINAHFDVGDPDAYHALGPDYEAKVGRGVEEVGDPAADDNYLVPTAYARGGHEIDESVTACPWPDCQFPDYPGTVGWKVGFRSYRDKLLSTSPPDLIENPPGSGAFDDPCDVESAAPGNDDGPGGACERRFDRNRKHMFRYLLGAHFVGLPKSEFPCVDKDGHPVPASAGGACSGAGQPGHAAPVADNGLFQTPRTVSGIADFPGADLMLTLGGFSDAAGRPVGTPYMQAGTLMHELGHTFDLGHAGVYLGPFAPEPPNCNPNYLSVMNYLFQLRGLFNAEEGKVGVPQADYSGQVLGTINESAPADLVNWTPPYFTGWYAPQAAFPTSTPVTRHCAGTALAAGTAEDSLSIGVGSRTFTTQENLPVATGVRLRAYPRGDYSKWMEGAIASYTGTSLTLNVTLTNGSGTFAAWDIQEAPVIRVDGPLNMGGTINWNFGVSMPAGQDINFDGQITELKGGSDDWSTLRLNQLASRRNVLGMSLDVGRDGIGRGETIGRDGIGRDGIGRDGIGRDGIGRDGIGRDGIGRDGIGRDGIGRDGIGRDGIGRDGIGQDWLGRDVNELDAELAVASGNAPPTGVTASFVPGACGGSTPELCHRIMVNFNATTVNPDTVVWYHIYRFRTDGTEAEQEVGKVEGTIYSKIDMTELPNAEYTYYVIAEFDGGDPLSASDNFFSGPSNFFTVLAVNDPPVATDDKYDVDQGATLIVGRPGVLGNDQSPSDLGYPHDSDSPSLKAALVSGPSHGTLTTPLAGDGSFIYTPLAGFAGTDSFIYTANDVDTTRSSNRATVTINVRDVTPPVVTLSLPAPTGSGGYFNTSPVAVTVSASDASGVNSLVCTDNGVELGVSGGQVSVATQGTHLLICTATDGAGNANTASGTVKIDTVAPAITITTPANGATYLVNAAIASSYSCSDPAPGSSVATCAGTVPNGSNIDTTVGSKTFKVTATDVAGNSATRTHTYSVGYNVTLTPLKSPVQQGSAVPVVWQVKDGTGAIISALSTVVRLESVFNGPGCVASQPGTKETLFSLPDGSTGKSTLRFVAPNFQFNWDTTSTSTSPIVTGKGCYTVLIYLNDDPSKPRMTTPVQLK